MLHTKFRENRPTGSGEEDFWRVFTIYGSGGYLGHVTPDAANKLSFPLPKEAPHKIWLWLVKRFQRRRSLKLLTTDGRRTDDGPWLSYKLAMSLRLRWAIKKLGHTAFSAIQASSVTTFIIGDDILFSRRADKNPYRHDRFLSALLLCG